ncbi:MAG: 16S rRNA (cytosine(1402)-N(4))-methyltransferase RsmH [Rickettsia sp.]|nr:16S rRNA (cytosine(1402)-N(4))-methyltransferase RsmH [Rickettsia sp.]
MSHIPVLTKEMIQILSPKDNKKYLDCTFGAGGHSLSILRNTYNSYLTSLDIDSKILNFVDILKNKYSNRFTFIKSNFTEIDKLFNQEKFDGIILDLGVSSMQLDSSERGFSFSKDGFLDMRMGNSELTAFDVINKFSREELANIIYELGEEVQSKQIANAIVSFRKKSPINSTLELAKIVRNAMHYRPSKIDLATKTFQAIRIYINNELDNLRIFLSKVRNILSLNGIILIISFHSLEDKIVKNFFREYAIKKKSSNSDGFLKIITKKPIVPSKEEIFINKRSRSAKLRAAQKICE